MWPDQCQINKIEVEANEPNPYQMLLLHWQFETHLFVLDFNVYSISY